LYTWGLCSGMPGGSTSQRLMFGAGWLSGFAPLGSPMFVLARLRRAELDRD
jgi:hypothetical protein